MAKPRPNILWITTDHQQWRTIGGRSACQTPNIQRIVDRGVLFDRSYAPLPVCCPVRAAWVSGAYPWNNGVFTQVHSAPSITRDMYPQTISYADRLRDAGYRCGFIGKWHASYARSPLEFGFDEVMHLEAVPRRMAESTPTTPDPPLPDRLPELVYTSHRQFSWPGSASFDMWGSYSGPVERLNSSRVGDCAVDMLQRYAGSQTPWHIAVHFPEPHDPYVPHEDYLRRYPADEMQVPQSFYDTFEGKPGMHRREAEIWGEVGEADVRDGITHFYAYCTQIDDQVGLILDALESTGQAKNTVIAFCSDHGDMMGAHRMWIKSWMPYEEAWRVPMVLATPDCVSGKTSPALVQTHDLPHTFVELAGAQQLPYQDGHALLPLLDGTVPETWPAARLGVSYGCEFLVTQRLLFTQRFTYVFNGFDVDEMYDLQSDPDQMRNVIADDSYDSERSALRGQLYEAMNRYGDPYGDHGPESDDRLIPSERPDRYGAPRYLPRG